MNKLILLCLINMAIIQQTNAQFKVANIFSSNMVLQRGVENTIWGWGEKAEQVDVEFNMQNYNTIINKHGQWEISLPKTSTGNSYEIKITSQGKTVKLSNIVFGDIWLCGGQSNMEWTVENSNNAAWEIKEANYPNIRLIEVDHKMSAKPAKDIPPTKWSVCNADNIASFSAVGYFFGRNLSTKLNIPIGLISCNYGGTTIETWMSANALRNIPQYQDKLALLDSINDIQKEIEKGKSDFDSWIGKFHTSDMGITDTTYTWANPKVDINLWGDMELPTTWENTGIDNLKEMDGVMWFAKDINIQNIGSPDGEVLLALGAIDDSDKVWINGKLVAETYNSYNKNRLYAIPKDNLVQGTNRIVIRIEDYVGAGGFSGTNDKFYLEIDNQKISLVSTWKYQVGMTPQTPFDGVVSGPNQYPTSLYNGMVAPISRLSIKGIIWYQGESNASQAYAYRDLFKRWIIDSRSTWHNANLPILFVQLANFEPQQKTPIPSQWAELRESQSMALSLPFTSMITAIDIGNPKNIHPTNKQEVAKRLSETALRSIYQKLDILDKSPSYKKHKINENSFVIEFNDIYDSLLIKNKFGYINGFTIADKSKEFKWAKATLIDENKIKIWHKDIKKPIAVRYSWQNNPLPANVFNSAGLPLLPFRTDLFKLSTEE